MSSFNFVRPVARRELLNSRRNAQSRFTVCFSRRHHRARSAFLAASNSRSAAISLRTVSSCPSTSTSRCAFPGGTNRHAAIVPRCLQGKGVGNFERRRQKSCSENFLHGRGRLRHASANAADSVARAGGNGSNSKRNLSNHAKHSFRSDKEADQIETGLVLMDASAGAKDSPLASTTSKPIT